MYLIDEGIKQLMDIQYAVGRRKTLEYLQMSGEEIKVADLEAASVVVFESVGVIVDVIAFSSGSISAEHLKSELVDMLVKYLFN